MRAKMSSLLLLASFVLCGSILLASGADIDCEIDLSSPCKCSFTDESGKRWNIDISGYFGGYPTNPTPDVEKYKYYYYCSNNVCPENKNKEEGVACQMDFEQKDVDTPLGKVDIDTTWVVTDTSDDSFSFIITYKNGQPVSDTKKRETEVTFKYSSEAMAMKVTGEKMEGDTIIYTMEATGNQVKKVALGGGSGGGGESKKGGGESKKGGNAAGPSEDKLQETQGAYSQESEKDTV